MQLMVRLLHVGRIGRVYLLAVPTGVTAPAPQTKGAGAAVLLQEPPPASFLGCSGRLSLAAGAGNYGRSRLAAALRGTTVEPDVWGGSCRQQQLLQSICSPDVEGGGQSPQLSAFVRLTFRNSDWGGGG